MGQKAPRSNRCPQGRVRPRRSLCALDPAEKPVQLTGHILPRGAAIAKSAAGPRTQRGSIFGAFGAHPSLETRLCRLMGGATKEPALATEHMMHPTPWDDLRETSCPKWVARIGGRSKGRAGYHDRRAGVACACRARYHREYQVKDGFPGTAPGQQRPLAAERSN